MSNEARETALNTIVELAQQHKISGDEIAARLSITSPVEKNKGIVARLFNYIGGIFVFSGIAILINLLWDDISSAQRVIITFGTGLVAIILGVVACKDTRFEKASTPLFLVSALLIPIGLFVFLDEYMPERGDPVTAAILIFGTLAAQYALIFFALNRSSLLFITLIFWNGFIATVLEKFEIEGEFIGIVLGISMLSLTYAIGKTEHRAIVPFWYFIGGATLLTSYWAEFEGTMLDISYLGLNAFLVYLSIVVASRTLLFVSVLGLFFYMGYFASEYFADVIGWPLSLIVLGLAMMGLSAYALKLGRKMKSVNS